MGCILCTYSNSSNNFSNHFKLRNMTPLIILISIFSFVACTETRNNNIKNLTFTKDDYITLGELEMLTEKQNFKP